MPKFFEPFHDLVFKKIHGNRLIYNTCWEDPRIDKALLNFDNHSQVVMITSAGCNALDYLLKGSSNIHAVDVNPRQNALLQLKIALIKLGSYDDLFQMFGRGYHPHYERIYKAARPYLPVCAAEFWKKNIKCFNPLRGKKSLYYYGTSGEVAWYFLKFFFGFQKKMKAAVVNLLNATSLKEQKEIYADIEPVLWNRLRTWIVKQPGLMAMLGVPIPQINLIQLHYSGGLSGFVKDKLRHVFTEIPITDNYFWRVYIMGGYTPSCCPNYLKKENFPILRQYVDRINNYTGTLTDFLKNNPGEYTHFILLDHQDWLAWHDPQSLSEEWTYILENSQTGTKILLRSAGWDLSFIPKAIRSALTFFPDLTDAYHPTDRVGTYGSLHLAEV